MPASCLVHCGSAFDELGTHRLSCWFIRGHYSRHASISKMWRGQCLLRFPVTWSLLQPVGQTASSLVEFP